MYIFFKKKNKHFEDIFIKLKIITAGEYDDVRGCSVNLCVYHFPFFSGLIGLGYIFIPNKVVFLINKKKDGPRCFILITDFHLSTIFLTFVTIAEISTHTLYLFRPSLL